MCSLKQGQSEVGEEAIEEDSTSDAIVSLFNTRHHSSDSTPDLKTIGASSFVDFS